MFCAEMIFTLLVSILALSRCHVLSIFEAHPEDTIDHIFFDQLDDQSKLCLYMTCEISRSRYGDYVSKSFHSGLRLSLRKVFKRWRSAEGSNKRALERILRTNKEVEPYAKHLFEWSKEEFKEYTVELMNSIRAWDNLSPTTIMIIHNVHPEIIITSLDVSG